MCITHDPHIDSDGTAKLTRDIVPCWTWDHWSNRVQQCASANHRDDCSNSVEHDHDRRQRTSELSPVHSSHRPQLFERSCLVNICRTRGAQLLRPWLDFNHSSGLRKHILGPDVHSNDRDKLSWCCYLLFSASFVFHCSL